MKHVLVASLIAALCLGSALAGTETTSQKTPVPSTASGNVVPADQNRELQPPEIVKLSPLHQRIQAVLQAEQVKAVSLLDRIARAHDNSQLVQLQRELEALKRDTEIEILRLQADYAREQGRIDQAVEIEAAIATILNPPHNLRSDDDPARPDKAERPGR